MRSSKRKIAIVNVFFPPQAVGGATRVVADEVSVLQSKYNDQFDFVVFSTDAFRQPAHLMHVYPYNGTRVYSPSSLWRHNMDWYAIDEQMGKLFDDFLTFEKPDAVHFHCLQRLTASIVDVTRKRNIPYFVTAHDAWWISDYQFLTDTSGRVYVDGHPDPFSDIPLLPGITRDQSLDRRRYLNSLLKDAVSVLCVSDAYTELYKKNGVTNCVTNKNGISNFVNWSPKDTTYTRRVVCAHIGGMAKHKGYHLFKQAMEQSRLTNIELLVVDDSKPEAFSDKTSWADTPVTIVGRVAQERVVELYQRIDVLFAPSICPESFGLVTREAVACGCWVVGSDVGAIGEDIVSSNGFRVTPTVDNLRSVISEIDRNPTKYKQHSHSPKVRFSSDQVSELVELFSAALADREQTDIERRSVSIREPSTTFN
ncbi:glycosyltransferase family 4 protein [Burkholderia cenocepacia]|nr:glycosyltransferase family 4 protein [Burkholderia cenocepacia]MBJ9913159.1 glycosyltransferase family 4 protein [Burkholderia cenocepacia]MBR8100098.1 glycosyltransferase family 4 protein [Burkholderia cenocepacia]MBR8271323.1 glycosyltransferase family 4 protein [Burkholderia cenocepacia]MDR8106437.1 glycosyltransferase family 4 protein [Burkholderia cenocepacia]